MDKRTLLIIIALLAPLVALAFLSQGPAKAVTPPPAADAKKNSPSTVSTPARALPATDGAAPPPMGPRRPPANLEEAKQRLKKRLADLEKMDEQDWQEEQRMKREQRGGGLPPLGPPTRLEDPAPQPATPPKDD